MESVLDVSRGAASGFRINGQYYTVRHAAYVRLSGTGFGSDGRVPLSRTPEGIHVGNIGLQLRRYVAQQVTFSDKMHAGACVPFSLDINLVDRVGAVFSRGNRFTFMAANNYGLHLPDMHGEVAFPHETKINTVGALLGYSSRTESTALLLSLLFMEGPELAIAHVPHEVVFRGLFKQ